MKDRGTAVVVGQTAGSVTTSSSDGYSVPSAFSVPPYFSSGGRGHASISAQ